MTPIQRIESMLSRNPYNSPYKDNAGVVIPRGADDQIKAVAFKEALQMAIEELKRNDDIRS